MLTAEKIARDRVHELQKEIERLELGTVEYQIAKNLDDVVAVTIVINPKGQLLV